MGDEIGEFMESISFFEISQIAESEKTRGQELIPIRKKKWKYELFVCKLRVRSGGEGVKNKLTVF